MKIGEYVTARDQGFSDEQIAKAGGISKKRLKDLKNNWGIKDDVKPKKKEDKPVLEKMEATKENYEKAKADGYTIKDIAGAFEMNPNQLNYKKRKWYEGEKQEESDDEQDWKSRALAAEEKAERQSKVDRDNNNTKSEISNLKNTLSQTKNELRKVRGDYQTLKEQKAELKKRAEKAEDYNTKMNMLKDETLAHLEDAIKERDEYKRFYETTEEKLHANAREWQEHYNEVHAGGSKWKERALKAEEEVQQERTARQALEEKLAYYENGGDSKSIMYFMNENEALREALRALGKVI